MDFSAGARKLNRLTLTLAALALCSVPVATSQSPAVHAQGIGVEIGGDKGLVNVDLSGGSQTDSSAPPASSSTPSDSGSSDSSSSAPATSAPATTPEDNMKVTGPATPDSGSKVKSNSTSSSKPRSNSTDTTSGKTDSISSSGTRGGSSSRTKNSATKRVSRGGANASRGSAEKSTAKRSSSNRAMPTESKSIITTTVGEIPKWMLGLLAALALTSLGVLFMWLRDRRRKQPVINVLATEDPETGFANHDAFESRLDHEWQRAYQFGSPLGLMSLELDGFAEHSNLITESELAALLGEISHVMRTELRPTDIIARPASGEFAVICPETDIGELIELRSNLERRFEADERITWDFNIGVAEATDSDLNSQDLVEHAHDALASRQRARKLVLVS